jgi:hypothetical protein
VEDINSMSRAVITLKTVSVPTQAHSSVLAQLCGIEACQVDFEKRRTEATRAPLAEVHILYWSFRSRPSLL